MNIRGKALHNFEVIFVVFFAKRNSRVLELLLTGLIYTETLAWLEEWPPIWAVLLYVKYVIPNSS